MKEGVFWYGTMSSGKSLTLITKVYNFRKANKIVDVFTFSGDYRYGVGRITTRFGKQSIEAQIYDENFSFKEYVKDKKIDYLFIDEAQFLKTWQVMELFFIYSLGICNVYCFGLETDFKQEFFEGSSALIRYFTRKEELETICSRCGKKAKFNVRVDKERNIIFEGKQIEIGGDGAYEAICPECLAKTLQKNIKS